MSDDFPTDYSARLQAFRKSDEDRDLLVTNIIKKYEELKFKYDEKHDDYQNEVRDTSRTSSMGQHGGVRRFSMYVFLTKQWLTGPSPLSGCFPPYVAAESTNQRAVSESVETSIGQTSIAVAC